MRKPILCIVGVVVLVAGWAVFRPELLFVNRQVNEALPPATAAAQGQAPSTTLATGAFHDGAHATSGTASLIDLGAGQRVLRLAGFSTSNGPDVRVLLGVAADAKDSDTVKQAGYVELGSLKGNVGDQNYDVPSDLDLSKYNSVTIWCNRFGVNFGTAPLARAAR